ncbi:DMT family transporter [Allosediminivita pacifica]|uniref:S-adenosylmethionine uptake transporter n=1 Tax=Allosediminivita pacifica TaxID=1267769 RepID=A0A2T6AP17_9RHOB|nr:DMT family transporter [Allosediminivita pacifica]PTX45559.1 S-adenosylmethionine uptake transporter [Allosediminivita pacifica]GGB20400.1 membrane protein [Allosediminivita pacifica]
MTDQSIDRPTAGIIFICAGVAAISVNDVLIKYLSGGYPLHQMIFIRSVIALIFSFAFVRMEGGLRILRTDRPLLHLLRGALVVFANMTFYAAVAVLPLGQATALFFAAPLFITLLSIPLLGERVGLPRIAAVLVGFAGVLVMQRPWEGNLEQARWVLMLPVIAAALYALLQVLTRRLGVTSPASALAVYSQVTFLLFSTGFFLVAGDGRFAEGVENDSLRFLLRPWIWPPADDWPLFIATGVCSGVIGYCLSAAYRLAAAATIAPFEYIGLPLAFFWGFAIFGEIPLPSTAIGCALIIASGLFVFLREQRRGRPQPGRRRLWGRR